MSESLLVELDSRGVLRLRLNKPEVHNAFDDQQTLLLINVLQEAAANPHVRVVVLGAAGKNFSAGADLNYMKRMAGNTYEENLFDGGQLANLMKTLNFLPKPTIARIQGVAFAGAVGLVSCCDLAVATPRARFALTEVKVGMAPATIAPYVVRAIGARMARRYFITGETFSAEKALAMGLLSEVVEAEVLDSTINGLIDGLLANAPKGIDKAKQIVSNVAAGNITEEMITYTVEVLADLRDSDEGREGLSAFLEKRPPNWQACSSK